MNTVQNQQAKTEKRYLEERYLGANHLSKLMRVTEDEVRERRRKIFKTVYHGCNEDCFNCEYPDCLKPYSEF